MSIFRETFPQFIIDELDRRQDGMLSRNFNFVHQLNTRSSWVRMTSGVNYENSNALASQYVLQGGTLNNNSLRYGLGENGTSTYDLKSPGGVQHRLGIRPMPGITDVSIQSKGAYGSLQEATVSFIAWDIKQLEDLELLYMRPGYTVLLEFGWDYIKPTVPKYDILNISEIVLNDAFKDIYQKIADSKGNYDALLGYVKNYNWSARDDGGYNCTTTIISLGEVLESLKCNWIPMATTAFGGDGLLGYGLNQGNDVAPYYETGIISGLIEELFYYMDQKANPLEGSLSYSRAFKDPKFGSTYHLYMSKRKGDIGKFNRGGLPKPLGKDITTEGYITLGSFCELLNNYVLLKTGKDTPLSQIITYETDAAGNALTEKDQFGNILPIPLKCIASPLSISTNYGICFVRNDNWQYLGTQEIKAETDEDKELTQQSTIVIPNDIKTAIQNKRLFSIGRSRITQKITSVGDVYNYVNGNLLEDLQNITKDLSTAIVKTNIIKDSNKNLIPEFIFADGNKFSSRLDDTSRYSYVSFFDYFNLTTLRTTAGTGGAGISTTTATKAEQIDQFYSDLFGDARDRPLYNNGKLYTPASIKAEINNIFSKASISRILRDQLTRQVSIITTAVSEAAANVPGLTSETLQFLVPEASANNKSLGYISNIYVNMDFLYSQAVSKNVSSNDPQNKNTISIREYIQGILREIQNSLGAINSFDLQVDNRNAIGRIIDINYTGDPNADLFTLQIHNLNSVVRNYYFQSKIFPEMGSIIAISAQDATGIGKLGYDNATLIAWNDGIKDRLIPKKDFTQKISVGDSDSPISFLFPFLTKLYTYFKALDGRGTDNKNLSYGGLDFAYRDFLANLNRYDLQNQFKAIIPTELSITLDGIGGIVIGNLFKINQDIVPRGYRAVPGRSVAYIVTKLGHSIQDNDWTTELSAYPVVMETAKSSEVWKKWNAEIYSGEVLVITGADGKPIVQLPALDTRVSKNSNIPVVKYLQGLGYKNGEIPDAGTNGEPLLRLLKIPDDSTSNSLHKLFPSAATKWEELVFAARKAGFTLGEFNISYTSEAAYRTLAEQTGGFGRAEPGNSVHGWGVAVDIQQLYTEAYEALPKPGYKPPAGATNNAFVRGSSALYQWLNQNAANYGWINPPLLKDGSGQDEAWHWEYWGPVTGGPIGGTETTTTPKGSDVPFIVAALKDATAGIGTDETALIEAISKIPDIGTFRAVNNKLNIENLLNSELGINDIPTLKKLQPIFTKIGVSLTYELRKGFTTDRVAIKLTF
jgi:hypothetical protein